MLLLFLYRASLGYQLDFPKKYQGTIQNRWPIAIQNLGFCLLQFGKVVMLLLTRFVEALKNSATIVIFVVAKIFL